jgi:uncharacterized membrane protein
MVRFFSQEEEAAIIAAIQRAERKTSGEIRVHVEKQCRGDILQEAVRIFKKLKMDRTALRNGVLILIAPENRSFAIIGDEGIDAVVPVGFWDKERDIMRDYFRRGSYGSGVCAVIDEVGDKLRAHFPVQEGDKNELSDEVSYGGSDE